MAVASGIRMLENLVDLLSRQILVDFSDKYRFRFHEFCSEFFCIRRNQHLVVWFVGLQRHQHSAGAVVFVVVSAQRYLGRVVLLIVAVKVVV